MSTLGIKERPIPTDELPTITERAMFEIVDGQLEEMEKMSMYAMSVSFILATALQEHVSANRLGHAWMEMLFRLPLNPVRCRRPDVAFVSVLRWPLDRPFSVKKNAWDVVPDLAVEVVSPHDRAMKLERKLNEYFDAGVRRVWLIHPENQIAKVYTSRTDVRILQSTDVLSDADVLPGFSIPLRSIFPPVAAEPATVAE